MINSELLAVCAGFVDKIPANLNYITPSELRKIQQNSPESVFILDVRNCESYEESHIEGATNIVLDDIFQVQNISRLPATTTIVVCCGIGHVASQVLTLLQLLGYDAVGLKYGMGISTVANEVQKGWVELGYPVSTGKD
ncbi:MAG TPA: rhodanese-like domain-containing protein [Desulfobacterales bacterium]|nr:rhodanese-like domain-containing protein [Desulfobacterales bacterium]HIP40106.1 rhodanese-like domain-containing protein [Desulfocapsa sulfexigens]